MSLLSVILPARDEEKNVLPMAIALAETLRNASIDYELLFVDDGSRDGTWEKIRAAAEADEGVRGVRFSRAFGKEGAIFAGLEAAAGDCCVVMDCDFQHPPETVPVMYSLWQQGYEVVEGVKEDRGKESAAYAASAAVFYRWLGRATGERMEQASDFKLLDRKVVDALNRMPERNVFFRALSYWLGFRRTTVPFTVGERKEGETKWDSRSLVRYALKNMASFSSAPLQIITFLGLFMLIVACVFGVIALAQKLTGRAMEGFTTVILLQLFTGSILMISLGIIGYYIARIYEEIQGRPRYVIREKCGKAEDDPYPRG